MTRVKRGTTSLKKRRNVLKEVKGFRIQRSKKERAAKDALRHAGAYAFAHRRDKKNDMRKLWNVRINALVRPLGITYSQFINKLKLKNITLDRKVLSQMGAQYPQAFTSLVEQVK
jgi:large subunit ribosomal protein L20